MATMWRLIVYPSVYPRAASFLKPTPRLLFKGQDEDTVVLILSFVTVVVEVVVVVILLLLLLI